MFEELDWIESESDAKQSKFMLIVHHVIFY